MEKSAKRMRLEEERDQLKDELANEFKFFSATNEFREGMLPEIIAVMIRYDRIERILKRYQDEVFTPVEGDTLHFLKDKPPAQ
jgi:lysyl-tRNA synthetase class I